MADPTGLGTTGTTGTQSPIRPSPMQSDMSKFGVSLYQNQGRVFAHEQGGWGQGGGVSEILNPGGLSQHGIDIAKLPTYRNMDELHAAGLNQANTGKANVNDLSQIIGKYQGNVGSGMWDAKGQNNYNTPGNPSTTFDPAAAKSQGDPNYAWGGKFNVPSGGVDPNAQNVRPPQPLNANPTQQTPQPPQPQQPFRPRGANEDMGAYLQAKQSAGGSGSNIDFGAGAGKPPPVRPPEQVMAAADIGSDANKTGSTPTSATGGYQQQIQDVQKLGSPSQAEQDLQKKIDAIDASARQGTVNAMGEPIPYSVKYGTAKNIEAQSQANTQNLTQQLGTLQKNRMAQLDAAKAALGIYAPKEIPMGGTLTQYNPQTGKYDTIGEGQSYNSKLASSSVFNLSHSYPDAGILPTDDLATAEYKAAQSQSFANKQTATGAIANPLTGEINYYDKKGPTSAASQGYTPSPTKQGVAPSSGTNFTLGSDGRTVLANGRPVGLDEFRQLTNQTGSKTDFSMVKGGVAQQKTAGRIFSNPTPSASSSSSNKTGLDSINFNPNNSKDAQALTMFQSGDTKPSRFPGLNGDIQARARQIAQALGLGSNYNLSSGKAVQEAIAQQTKYGANLQSAVTTVDKNLGLLTGLMGKVNTSDSPFINDLNKGVNNRVITNDDRVAFTTALQTVRSEYGRILARGGVPDDRTANDAAKLLPDNISGKALQRAINVLKSEGKNVVSGNQSTIDFLKGMGATQSNSGITGTNGQSIDLKF
ncbi:MAG TPA: hypothetical protein VF974_04900 [Patescibacteria group bacterium]